MISGQPLYISCSSSARQEIVTCLFLSSTQSTIIIICDFHAIHYDPNRVVVGLGFFNPLKEPYILATIFALNSSVWLDTLKNSLVFIEHPFISVFK